MTLEVLLLCSLIFVFIVSFCGLLQKIKQSYDRERTIAGRHSGKAAVATGVALIAIFATCIRICLRIRACRKAKRTRRQLAAIIVQNETEERIARQHTTTLRDGNSDAHVNSTFVEDFDSIHFDREDAIFPGAPPRYGPLEAPPKYEDIFKAEANITRHLPTAPPPTIRTPARSHTNTRTTQAPPPYTIST